MKCKPTTIHLNGEAPRIGSGRRQVEVVTVGRKWTKVRYWPGGHNGHSINQRFLNAAFEKIVVA